MGKSISDAELIAEFEKLEREIASNPQLFKLTASPITNELFTACFDLAARLKAKNEEFDRMECAWRNEVDWQKERLARVSKELDFERTRGFRRCKRL